MTRLRDAGQPQGLQARALTHVVAFHAPVSSISSDVSAPSDCCVTRHACMPVTTGGQLNNFVQRGAQEPHWGRRDRAGEQRIYLTTDLFTIYLRLFTGIFTRILFIDVLCWVQRGEQEPHW